MSVAYLRSLAAVRERSQAVFDLALAGDADCWTLDLSRESAVVDMIVELIDRDYGGDVTKIPPHGRLTHFNHGRNRIEPLLAGWKDVDSAERCRRMVDLTLVSVLLDAGAGSWMYCEPGNPEPIGRSEGLAVASLDMFEAGFFSADPASPCRVDAAKLARLTPKEIARAMQSGPDNQMAGIEGRARLLIRLGRVLADSANADVFPHARPGDMFDYLRQGTPSFDKLWEILLVRLAPIWPQGRTTVEDVSMGDVWACPSLQRKTGGDGLVPFHKLSQWLCYSLVEVLGKVGDLRFEGKSPQTGLPEYRNGGLLIDLGVLVPRNPSQLATPFEVDSPAIVEMRAITVAELDRLHIALAKRLDAPDLTLAQTLQAGTWTAGREIAKKLRRNGSPPIKIISNGTVF